MARAAPGARGRRQGPRKVVVWRPQPGGQHLFLSCPFFESLFEGTRGAAKTDALLMDFAQHCGQGFGVHWRGILFRQTYPQLADVVARTKRWFHRIFPGIQFNEQSYTWKWPTGEELLLRHMRVPADYWNYHGHEYPWIGWDELTNWATLECYDAMKACSRSSYAGMPRKYRATANPYGRGHNAVKARFIDPAPAGIPIADSAGLLRVRVHGHWRENLMLLAADPEYPAKLQADANEMRRRAWKDADWDIVAGGMFDDVWDPAVHVLAPFEPPSTWYLDRSFDWGSSKPFSVGWWAESDGTEATMRDGTRRTFPRGTLFRLAEWYGWNGQPNEGLRLTDSEVGRGTAQREKEMAWGGRVRPGPADASIFDQVNDDSPAAEHERNGISWERADKSPGSRVRGWEVLRRRLQASKARPMEEPGLFVFETCRQWLRTVPTLVRDEKNPDDVDTESEDHAADETRYRLLTSGGGAGSSEVRL